MCHHLGDIIAWGRGECGTGSFFAAVELALKRAKRKK
jgi:hypothetical protein